MASKKIADLLQKVAIYIRVSTLYQIDKDSLPMQREELINYAKYVLGITNFEIFEDAGYSGKNTDRPAYQRMMSRLRSGEFSHVLVWKLDRISRNLLDFAAMYSELKDIGVTFVSKNEQFDTSSAMGEAMLKIILVFAELERSITSERVSATMISRASNGLWNGGKIPYGYEYDKDNRTFSINDIEARWVRFMYEGHLNGTTLLEMTRYLNDNNVTTKNNVKWSPTTVRKILSSQFYTGVYRYNYLNEKKGHSVRNINPASEWVLIEDHHPAIVTEDEWRKSVAVLESRRRSSFSPKTKQVKNIHVFSGLCTCGICGAQMNATIDKARKNGWRPSIYHCATKRQTSECNNKYISDMVLGKFAFNYISNIIKAQRSFGKTTSKETLQKKLLRGDAFVGIKAIDDFGLTEIYNLLREGINEPIMLRQTERHNIQERKATEREFITREKTKAERALSRLKSLYLYSEEGLPEVEFITEQNVLITKIKELDEQLNQLSIESGDYSISDDEFMAKASYFILSNELSSLRSIDYHNLLHSTDARLLKQFVNSVCSNFCVKDGKILSIRFKNGIEHKFLYNEE